MELFLNTAWAIVAVAIVRLWLRLERRDTAAKQRSLVAIVMLLVILFPAISVSDDLWSIQNPAETPTCQRRDYLNPCSHSIVPVVADITEPAFGELALGFQRFKLPPHPPLFTTYNPATYSIQNRPPPSA